MCSPNFFFLNILAIMLVWVLQAADQDGICSVAQSCLTLCNPLDCSPPGCSVHGMFQARILEWAAISYSRGSSQPRDQTCISYISCIAGTFFTTEPLRKPKMALKINKYILLREMLIIIKLVMACLAFIIIVLNVSLDW